LNTFRAVSESIFLSNSAAWSQTMASSAGMASRAPTLG
jgi:hypothetical protein